ncbi:G patch domain-containing protein 1-like [Gigantopelta aegis]|uniref:G patch domain-containing protein 1-like n=1 Tax=Gigantopelta aegis TaxID=1735272 RepID=UPI001B887BF6|nr:G patch domain-containing protein 1-like [Gigantopelta aegis]
MSASMDSDEETFVTLGSPLEVFEDDEPIKKPVSIYDIQARDSKGRPRFHGAFTGGFSAGFFNTVGSKEGFTPSTFVSSRSSKAEASSRNVEDFMDEEDLGEHGIAPQKYTTSSEYTSEERSRKRKAMAASLSSSSIIPGEPALVDLIIPERLSVGVRLLRKMGWKEGQGIGPRRKKKKKKKGSSVRVVGCALLPSESDEESDDDFICDVTFAPKDTTPISFEAKDNVHGLGYHGLDPTAALPSSHVNLFGPPPVRSGGRKGIRGQAFGVGALEEEDSDIYSTDHLSNYDMTMEIEDKDNNFGWTAPGKHKPASPSSLPVGYLGKLLAGFTLSSKPLSQKKVFKPPSLPRHYRPVHHFKKIQPEAAVQQTLNQSDSMTQPRRKEPLNAVDRGLMLGETPIFTSVFDLVSKDDKKKMEEVKLSTHHTDGKDNRDKSDDNCIHNRGHDHSSTDQTAAHTEASEHRPDLTKTETSQPVALIKGNLSFKPFLRDSEKQARYELYLNHIRQGHKDPYAAASDKHMTEWEHDKEREEFTKSAKLYKPMVGLMAHRFTTAKYSDEVDKADIPVDETVEKSEQAKAAEMKMFGHLTRDECEWVPDKLLCRRFNVPHPYPGSTVVGVPTVRKEKFSVFNFLNFSDSSTAAQSPATQAPSTQAPLAIQFDGKSHQHQQGSDVSSDKGSGLSIKVKPRSLGKPASIFSVLDDDHRKRKPPGTESESTAGVSHVSPVQKTQENSEASNDRPPIDLFKAIFKNSDSESSSTSDSEDDAVARNTDVITTDTNRTHTNDVVVNRADNSKPQDDEIQKRLPSHELSAADQQHLSPPAAETGADRLSSPVVSGDIPDTASTYGPALPPRHLTAASVEASTCGTDVVFAKTVSNVRGSTSERKTSP